MTITANYIPSENDPELKYRILVEWEDDQFSFWLLINEKSYEGTVKREYISTQCELLHISTEDYMIESKSALSFTETENFSYICENGRFKWKKKLDTGIRVLFGSIDLQPVPYVMAADKFIDYFLTSQQRSSLAASDLYKENEILRSNCSKMFNILTRAKELNSQLRRTLCSQFLTLLNSKKSKIRSLKAD